jgi:glycosyltransferase involved in cell wall biosynthesis
MAGQSVTPRRKVLCLLPFVPHLDGRHGGARAVAQTVLALSTRFEVGVVAIRSKGEPEVDARIGEACAFFETISRDGVPFLQRIAREVHARRPGGDPAWIARWRVPGAEERFRTLMRDWRPDVAQVEFHVMAQFAGSLREGSVPIVLTHHEAATPAARERAALATGIERVVAESEARAWQRYEERVLRLVDAVVALSERDRAAIAAMAPGVLVRSIPLAPRVPKEPSSATGRVAGRAVFVGNFVHPPNVDAAAWLLGEIFPRVQQELPDATLEIVGPHLPAHVRAAAGKGVVIAGEVDDVAPHLDAAAVVVAPVRIGGGARVKVLDALGAGKAVVTTTRGAEGIGVEQGKHLMIADDADAFARAVAGLLRDESQRAALGTAARGWAVAGAGLSGTAEAYAQLYDELLARAR